MKPAFAERMIMINMIQETGEPTPIE